MGEGEQIILPQSPQTKPESAQRFLPVIDYLGAKNDAITASIQEYKKWQAESKEQYSKPPTNLKERFSRFFSAGSEDHTETIQEEERQQRDIRAAILELRSGKTERAEHVLDWYIELARSVTGLGRIQDVAGDKVALSAIEDAFKAITAMETINPEKAAKLREEFNKRKKSNTPYYMKNGSSEE